MDDKFFNERDPKNLPWKKLKVDIVLECSGVFASKEKSNSRAKQLVVHEPFDVYFLVFINVFLFTS